MHIYQIHVPKTGGSSLRAYAVQNKLIWTPSVNKGVHKIFSECSIPTGAITLTTLRCPVRQLVSRYSYHGGQNNPKKGSDYWHCVHQSFSDYIRNPEVNLNSDRPWSYVTFFGASDRSDKGTFEKALANLKAIDYVLDTTHLTKQFNKRVVAKHGLPRFNFHTNKSKSFSVSKEDADYIKKRKAEDVELCRIFGIDVL